MIAQEVKKAIEAYLKKGGAQLLDEPTCVDGEWVALVALAPSGPLVKMGFRVSMQ